MERSKSLSIKYLRGYKIATIGIVSLFFGMYLINFISKNVWFGALMAIGYSLLMIFYWYPSFSKFIRSLKEVSYDNENLYVKEGDYEIQIPFYQVKDIEIMSLDGLYKFNLYHHDQFGNEVICKPSLWYPLNYKRVDKELNRIRSMVRKAHFNYKEVDVSGNRLMSYN